MSTGNVFLVSGMSGSGKSVCLRHFEDMEYEVIRGLPVEFLDSLINSINRDEHERNVAIEIFSKSLISAKSHVIDLIKKNKIKVIYLDASDESLLLRYKESRRRHPLDIESVVNGISFERKKLCDIREISDFIIDTTSITPYELKMVMNKEIFGHVGKTRIVVMSFSYKRGVPNEADCIFDVRFLKNPYYSPDLRALNGGQKEIQEYLGCDENVKKFISKTQDYLSTVVDLLNKEGRDLFYVAFGCTGGFHRSVFVAERIAEYFTKRGVDVVLMHRDLKIIKT